MRRQQLSGTLDEQCAFLYELALEKMEQGNFTGAYHALKEVARHQPDFREVQAQLAEATFRKNEQRFLLLFVFVGALGFVYIGSGLNFGNDLLFIGFAFLGSVLGFAIGYAINALRRRGRAAGSKASAVD